MQTDLELAAPKRRRMLLEARTAIDVARMVSPLVSARLTRAERRDDLLVIVVPGFGADDHSMAPLRYFLRQRGLSLQGNDSVTSRLFF